MTKLSDAEVDAAIEKLARMERRWSESYRNTSQKAFRHYGRFADALDIVLAERRERREQHTRPRDSSDV